MADSFVALRSALADLPKIERWFVVGAPWGKGDFIVAGHPDPHLGRYIADTEDFDGEGEHVLEHAAFIAAANPATVARLLQERDALLAAQITNAEHANRYAWLRERDLSTILQGGVFAGKTPENVVLNGADLDAAIDAERASTRL